MIYTKLISGLGNQLFQYAVARQLSLQNNTSLQLDLSFFDDQNLRSYKLHHFNINASVASKEEVDSLLAKYHSNSILSKISRKLEHMLPKRNRLYFKEDQWWHYEPELYQVKGNCYLDGYWQCYEYFTHLDPRVISELRIKDVSETVQYPVYNELDQESSSVSIHIRRGDYITDVNANKLMGVLPLSYYQQGIVYIKSKVKNPVFYIFSDDLDWAKKNLNIEGQVQLVDIASGTKDYLELDLMSKCKHNIIANSSFSWWGAYLNPNKQKIVIAPKKWVVPEDINNTIHIQFPEWIKF